MGDGRARRSGTTDIRVWCNLDDRLQPQPSSDSLLRSFWREANEETRSVARSTDRSARCEWVRFSFDGRQSGRQRSQPPPEHQQYRSTYSLAEDLRRGEYLSILSGTMRRLKERTSSPSDRAGLTSSIVLGMTALFQMDMFEGGVIDAAPRHQGADLFLPLLEKWTAMERL